MTVAIILDALSKALMKRAGTTKTIMHSDRGRQYVSGKLEPIYTKHGLVASMGSTGSCYDNAITETFFHTLKNELVYLTKFETRDQAQMELFDYIEIFYNRQRRHSAINYLSPAEYEKSINQS